MNIAWILVFPFIGFIINGLRHLMFGPRSSVKLSGVVATIAMILAFVFSLKMFLALGQEAGGSIQQTLFSWINLGPVNVEFALRFDRLSGLFALVITGVGSLIHLYSISYMGHDEGGTKYFSYLNLFCFMMLNLVLGATLPHVFLGWEGVGLASYLLIGFWYQDPLKVLAGQKAFVMNRIGDLGFLIAMFVAFKFVGSLDLIAINEATLAPAVVTTFSLLIFLACTGKSAQIPLFTWLPDAMAGPTPVSALIHAATMVTSGIYLLSRLSGVISQSETAMFIIATVGALTALMTAIIACFQSDIKKVLAYSTVSQLGLMFVACGVGAFQVGVFHVMTHAFFKALLFLAAGSVIHALHEEQNIFKMGGLRKKLPITFLTFTAGWAAILGLPPFSGFFSKDEIIFEALSGPHGNGLLFALSISAALLTAFYMTRLYILVFFGASRMGAEKEKSIHESPPVMSVPLILLALAAIGGGWFGLPWSGQLSGQQNEMTSHASVAVLSHGMVMALSVLVALMGAIVAYKKYSGKISEERVSDVFRLDQVYSIVFGEGLRSVASGVGRWMEGYLVQGSMRLVAAVTDLSGNLFRVVQVGSAQIYLLMMVIAILGIIAFMLTGVLNHG